jgi:GDPmannose 4,6-dehydratase
MWQMLQQNAPEDYVVATGVTRSVRDFAMAAFAVVGIDDWQRYIEVDTTLFRPAEVDLLIGDITKAHKQLGWQPTVLFENLVKMMVESDVETLSHENALAPRKFSYARLG